MPVVAKHFLHGVLCPDNTRRTMTVRDEMDTVWGQVPCTVVVGDELVYGVVTLYPGIECPVFQTDTTQGAWWQFGSEAVYRAIMEAGQQIVVAVDADAHYGLADMENGSVALYHWREYSYVARWNRKVLVPSALDTTKYVFTRNDDGVYPMALPMPEWVRAIMPYDRLEELVQVAEYVAYHGQLRQVVSRGAVR